MAFQLHRRWAGLTLFSIQDGRAASVWSCITAALRWIERRQAGPEFGISEGLIYRRQEHHRWRKDQMTLFDPARMGRSSFHPWQLPFHSLSRYSSPPLYLPFSRTS
ncbi:hypothetical protein P4050_16505, partial [Pseudomonas aeruginosa]|nr:hypothetical protein [Pseudomonas aeruginosa]